MTSRACSIPRFPHRLWFHQQPSHASAIWREGAAGDADMCEAWSGGPDGVVPMAASDGLYHLVAAAATPGALPRPRRAFRCTPTATTPSLRARKPMPPR